MKKCLILVIICLFSLSCGCGNVKLTPLTQSEKNFEIYEDQLTKVAKKYGYTIEKCNGDERLKEIKPYNSLSITLNGAERIEITMHNDVYYYKKSGEYVESDKGVEYFCVDYILWGENAENFEYDTHLFVDISNVISGREISATQVEKFLQSSENEYVDNESAMYKIRKKEDVNFWADWGFSYDLTLQGEGTLSFYGLTKQIGGT